MKRFLGLAAMALSVFSAASLSSSADAACTVQSAIPIKAALSSNGVCTIYFHPYTFFNSTGALSVTTTGNPALLGYYWSSTVSTTSTTGAALCEIAANAVTTQTMIAIVGNAAVCPAPGNATIGTLTSLNVN